MESQVLTGYSVPLTDRYRPLKEARDRLRRIPLHVRWQVAIYLIGVFPGLWIVFMTQGTFNTPDEYSRHFTASNFAEHFRFSFSDEVTTVAKSGSVAPRGYSLSDGTAVPNHSLGFLLVLGMTHLLLPDVLVPTVLVLLSGLLFLVWARVINRLVGSSWHFTGLLVLGAAPLWYWAARPYMETAVVVLLLGVAMHLVTTAYRDRSTMHFKAALAALAFASMLRTPDAIFLGLVAIGFAVVFLRRTGSYRWSDSKEAYLWLIGTQAAIFVLPTMILNWLTNGSPVALGYTIFLSQEYPTENQSPTNPMSFLFAAFKTALVPSSFDINVLRNGFFYQVMFMNPALLVVGIAGLWMYRKRIKLILGTPGLIVAGMAILYLLLSRADTETFGALQTSPDLDISLVRYWVPLYLLLALGVALSLRHLPSRSHLPLVGLILVQSVFMVYFTGTTPVPRLIDTTRDNVARYEVGIDEVVEEDAVVVVTSSQDKWVALNRRTIGVWDPTPVTLGNVGDTVVNLVGRGVPVYLLDDRSANTAYLTDYVELAGIDHERADSELTGLRFVKFGLAPRELGVAETSDGAYQASVDVPVDSFSILVANDGSSTNYVANPSFEGSLEGWAIRGDGEVVISEDRAAFGSSSMLMSIEDAQGDGDANSARANLVSQEIPEGQWMVRARVLPAVLDGAVAGVRIHVRDGQGNLLDRGYEEITEPADTFAVLRTPLKELPAGASEILIQLVVIPQREGAMAEVYWDGVELLSSAAAEYCDGDTNGCAWTGEPHESISARDSKLRGVGITSDGATVTLNRPISSGQSISMENGLITVVDPDGDTVGEPELLEWSIENPLTIKFDAESMPSLVHIVSE